jgi:hypothetical protein
MQWVGSLPWALSYEGRENMFLAHSKAYFDVRDQHLVCVRPGGPYSLGELVALPDAPQEDWGLINKDIAKKSHGALEVA